MLKLKMTELLSRKLNQSSRLEIGINVLKISLVKVLLLTRILRIIAQKKGAYKMNMGVT